MYESQEIYCAKNWIEKLKIFVDLNFNNVKNVAKTKSLMTIFFFLFNQLVLSINLDWKSLWIVQDQIYTC